MATQKTDDKDLVARIKDAGGDAIQKIGDVPGGKMALDALNGLRDRIDDLQKRMKRVDELEEARRGAREGRQEAGPAQALLERFASVFEVDPQDELGRASDPDPEGSGDDLEARRRRSGLLAVEHDWKRGI